MATPDLTPQNPTSRRRFLGAAGAGVAVIGVAGATSAFAGSASASTLGTEEVVLTVADAAKGEFNILVGERSVPITDLEFASKIAKAIA